MDYHLDSRAHDSDYFTPSPDKNNKIIEPRIMNMQSYQVLETSSSSRSTLSSCSDSSSPVLSKPSNKPIAKASQSAQNQIQTVSKPQNVGTSESDRPPHSYIALISMAILSKIDRKILLNEIYDWVIQHFPYYQSRTDKSWRNSIRHNLSLNECFVKVGKAGNGRGYYWSIHSANLNDFKKGDFRRRQARLRAKHEKNHSSPNTKAPKEPKEKTSPTQATSNAQNFQNNYYPSISSSSSYSNPEFTNFYGQNTYPNCNYSTQNNNYETNEYFYPFKQEPIINDTNYLSPNISSSSSSSKESSASNSLLTTTNQTPLTPLTPITTNHKSSSSSSTSSSLSSSPLSSTNISSSSSFYQNYNHINSNSWFQQPIIDHFQSNNSYGYTGTGAQIYANQQYQNMYNYNAQSTINQSNSSILMPLSTNETHVPEAQSPSMESLIYCTNQQQNDYAQYNNRSNFNFL